MQRPSIKNYRLPTSVLMRKIGDALLMLSGALSSFAIMEEMKYLALTSVIVGIAGKFFTNLYARK